MKVTWHPKGSEPTVYDYDQEDVLGSHCIMIEKRSGLTWERFNAGVLTGSMACRRVLLWYLTFRDHPAYQLRDVPDFRARELKVEQTHAELAEAMRRVEKLKPIDEADARENEQIIAILRMQMDEAAEREGIEVDGETDEDGPKAETTPTWG